MSSGDEGTWASEADFSTDGVLAVRAIFRGVKAWVSIRYCWIEDLPAQMPGLGVSFGMCLFVWGSFYSPPQIPINMLMRCVYCNFLRFRVMFLLLSHGLYECFFSTTRGLAKLNGSEVLLVEVKSRFAFLQLEPRFMRQVELRHLPKTHHMA